MFSIGGVDNSLYVGDLSYNPVIGNNGFWQIALDSLSVNGTLITSGPSNVVIDTGTSKSFYFYRLKENSKENSKD